MHLGDVEERRERQLCSNKGQCESRGVAKGRVGCACLFAAVQQQIESGGQQRAAAVLLQQRDALERNQLLIEE